MYIGKGRKNEQQQFQYRSSCNSVRRVFGAQVVQCHRLELVVGHRPPLGMSGAPVRHRTADEFLRPNKEITFGDPVAQR